MSTAIKVENLSKQYRLGELGTGTLSHDLNRWWHKLRGKEDPYLKIGEVNDRSIKGISEYVWALRDINFEVKQGEVLGIIGKNGAGKSTLLKLLSRVTAPTTGSIRARGRIASLLEVGTGFHEELTGRENIFLNGAILGMTKTEIRAKFDEIVAFSGTERYVDTPIKRYSSGMRVRLAFAVAAHLEPEILIVDEVLAVGDAEFQSKAIGKMQDISKGEGRTVLFVSHNLGSVKALCHTGIVLQSGQMVFGDSIENAVNYYLEGAGNMSRMSTWEPTNKEVVLNSAKIVDEKGSLENMLTTSNNIFVEIEYLIKSQVKNLRVVVGLLTGDGTELFVTSDYNYQGEYRIREAGVYRSICKLPKNLLNAGKYYIRIDIEIPKVKSIVKDRMVSFEVAELTHNQFGPTLKAVPPGYLHPSLDWQIVEAF